MNNFPLKIVTPDGLHYDGTAEQITVRTTTGDIGILAGHINYVAPLGTGQTAVVADGKRRTATCMGGILSVMDGKVTLICTSFAWDNKNDSDRMTREFSSKNP